MSTRRTVEMVVAAALVLATLSLGAYVAIDFLGQDSGDHGAVHAEPVSEPPANATVVPHDDERIADNDALQSVLREAVESGGGWQTLSEREHRAVVTGLESLSEERADDSGPVYVRYDGTVVAISDFVLTE